MIRMGLDNILGFALHSISVTTAEELLVYVYDGGLAKSPLALDLLWINLTRLGWTLPWNLLIRRRYTFTGREALLVGQHIRNLLRDNRLGATLLKCAASPCPDLIA